MGKKKKEKNKTKKRMTSPGQLTVKFDFQAKFAFQAKFIKRQSIFWVLFYWIRQTFFHNRRKQEYRILFMEIIKDVLKNSAGAVSWLLFLSIKESPKIICPPCISITALLYLLTTLKRQKIIREELSSAFTYNFDWYNSKQVLSGNAQEKMC